MARLLIYRRRYLKNYDAIVSRIFLSSDMMTWEIYYIRDI